MNNRENVTYGLLIAALISIPLILEIGLFPFLPDTLTEYRTVKEFLAVLFAAGIFIWALHGHHRVGCVNPWLGILVGYILLHPFLSPRYSLILFNQNIAGFWEYKPLLYALMYFGFFCVISQLRLHFGYFETIFKVLMWLGVGTAVYALLQRIGLDQFQYWSSDVHLRAVTNGEMTATMTQPNYAGAYLAFVIPFAFYFRRWWAVILIGVAVIAIDSKFGIAAMVCALVFMFLRTKKQLYSIFVALALGALIMGWSLFEGAADWSDSGRFAIWQTVWHDIVSPWVGTKAYPLTGYGPGSFRFIWTAFHHSGWMEVHNEWLQFGLEAGLLGVTLWIFSIFWLIRRLKPFTIEDDQVKPLFASFVAMLVSTCGLFTLQIDPHRFMAVTVFALLHNKLLIKRGGT